MSFLYIKFIANMQDELSPWPSLSSLCGKSNSAMVLSFLSLWDSPLCVWSCNWVLLDQQKTWDFLIHYRFCFFYHFFDAS